MKNNKVLTSDIISNKKLFLFDMDGTIYKDDILFDGVIELFNKIRGKGDNYVFVTNNSSKSLDDYILKINRLGILATTENFYTSTQATISYIKNNYNQDDIIYACGTKSFVDELKQNCLNVVTEIVPNIKVVLVGFDTELKYKKLIDISKLLTTNVDFIATNPDLVCPTEFGFIPDCGSICAMIYNATKRVPKFIGKPNKEMIESILDHYSCAANETLIIGDRLYTDIASGINSGVDTLCVLTGETTADDIINTEYKPTYVLERIGEILPYFSKDVKR